MRPTARPRTPIDRAALLAALQSINMRLSASGHVAVPGLPGRHPRLFGQLVPDATEHGATPAPSADYAVQIVGQAPRVLSVTAMGVIANDRPDATRVTGYLLPKVLVSALPQWHVGPRWLLDTLPRLWMVLTIAPEGGD